MRKGLEKKLEERRMRMRKEMEKKETGKGRAPRMIYEASHVNNTLNGKDY